jgi:1-acyl-sn-glycerol-3-phosphate acyltransferase
VTALPFVGASVPRRGNAPVRAFGRALLAILRWRVEGEVPDLPKFVIAVGPHTSNWDFVVGMAVMFALDLRLSFIGKHTIFRGPFAPLLRWMGGIPVDRAHHHGLVREAVRAFECVDQRVLAIAPQGTRRRVERLRSGFLHIARDAAVPILLAAFDYEARAVRFGPLFEPGPDIEQELRRVEAFFSGVRGKRPR